MSGVSLSIGVIADDFTGAMDAGVQFVKAGLEAALLLSPGRAWLSPVQIVNTNSRDVSVTAAQEQAVRAARLFQGRLLFKKIDSTMRGHIAAEILSILHFTRIPRAVVCPAVIEAGRTLHDGQLWIDDRPLHQSDCAHDPSWPVARSDIAGLLGVPVTHLDLACVRTGPDALARVISTAPTPIITVDACIESDLALIGRAILATGSLPCGALGLARAWITALVGSQPGRSRLIPPATAAPLLLVLGSRHPITRAQMHQAARKRNLASVEVLPGPGESARHWPALERALSCGRSAIIHTLHTDIRTADARRALSLQLAVLTRQACRTFNLGGLVLSGGETANAVCHGLGTEVVQISGELEAGIPWGTLIGGTATGLPVITKAGGFGDIHSLINVVDALRGGVSDLSEK